MTNTTNTLEQVQAGDILISVYKDTEIADKNSTTVRVLRVNKNTITVMNKNTKTTDGLHKEFKISKQTGVRTGASDRSRKYVPITTELEKQQQASIEEYEESRIRREQEAEERRSNPHWQIASELLNLTYGGKSEEDLMEEYTETQLRDAIAALKGE